LDRNLVRDEHVVALQHMLTVQPNVTKSGQPREIQRVLRIGHRPIRRANGGIKREPVPPHMGIKINGRVIDVPLIEATQHTAHGGGAWHGCPLVVWRGCLVSVGMLLAEGPTTTQTAKVNLVLVNERCAGHDGHGPAFD
jgi:hypothetical protein